MALLCALALDVRAHQRGEVAGYQVLLTATPAQIMASIQTGLDPDSYALVDLLTRKSYEVAAVKVVYWTIDGKGLPTLASGALFVPVIYPGTTVPVFAYLHGTLTRHADLPSNLGGVESMIGWVMAMDGYLAVLPDYIGMEFGPGIHPYSHAATEASATVDLLKAVQALCLFPAIPAKPNGNLYLSGYSQGGHAALATQRELQSNPIPGLALQKTVAGSGAYSMSGVQKLFMLANPNYPNPAFIPYMILGYQGVYGNLYTKLNQVFKGPYHTFIEGLFDGSKTVEEIDAYLPVNWMEMLTNQYLKGFRYDYYHPSNVAMRDNDLINWKPASDLHLYYCNCDELVAKENSMVAYLSFLMKGSLNVTLLSLGNFSHAECAPYMLIVAKLQFDLASGLLLSPPDKETVAAGLKSGGADEVAFLMDALDPEATMSANDLYANPVVAGFFQGDLTVAVQLELFPNPATDRVFVTLPDGLGSSVQIRVYDMQGRVVLFLTDCENLVELDVSGLPEGLYQVVIPDLPGCTGRIMVVR